MERLIDWSVSQFTRTGSGTFHLPRSLIKSAEVGFWVPFAAVRLPRQLQNALDWLRFDVLAKRDPRTLAIAGGGIVALLLIGWVIVANPFRAEEEARRAR